MRVAIETSGCSANAADGHVLAAVLERHGHAVIDTADTADVVVLNTCTVKDGSFRSFERRMAELSDLGVGMVVAGCIPTAHADSALWEGRVVVGVNNLTDIAAAVVRAAEGIEARFLDGAPRSDRLEMPARPHSPVIEIIPVNQGCLSNCSFCETKLARGRLVSYPIVSIRRRVEQALERGAKEIWLTSQDTAAYGHDIGVRLRDLLAEMVSISGEFRMRLGMANPLYLKGQEEAVAEALRSPSFFRFLHFPLQSGSDAVLRRMRRGYRAHEWIDMARRFASTVPGLTLATDVIVGFPGETDDDYRQTVAALDAVGPVVVNRSKFSPRPKTAAARLEPLPGRVVHERSIEIDRWLRARVEATFTPWIGRTARCLVDEHRRAGSVLARTDNYRPVALPVDDAEISAWLGRFVDVAIEKADGFHLIGRAPALVYG